MQAGKLGRGSHPPPGLAGGLAIALNILLIEDDALLGALLAEMLVGLGHAVAPVQATEDGAIAAAARRTPDLIIADVSLAKGDGVAAVERITRAGPVPHVFMSGFGPRAVPSGAVVLTKPFREADLVRAIARIMGSTDTLA